MITAKEIRTALTDFLKNQAGLPYEVHFDVNHESSASYFYVEISEQRKTVDPIYYDRVLKVDIQLVLLPDKVGRIHRAKLYEVTDTLNSVLRPIFQIGDRYITVQNTSSRIFDDILHYQFELSFTDYLPGPSYPLAETLDLNFVVEGTGEIKEEETNGE